MNIKRMRGRNNRGPGGGGGGSGGGQIRHHNSGGGVPLNRNHVFDSNGPDLRIRGTAQQLFEKYLQLGRDATSSGDRVMAESYFQHAEHYFRILNAMAQAAQQQGQPNGQHQQPRRQTMQDTAPELQEGQSDGDEADGEAQVMPPPMSAAQHNAANQSGMSYSGAGDQPGSNGDARDIPISAAPPEG